jgi:hypothetical protein
MGYAEMGVQCTESNLPVCSLDQKICDVKKCRYFVPCQHLGNCVLRVDKGDKFTLDQIASMFGISRQRVDKIEEHALKKLRKYHWIELKEMLTEFKGHHKG